MADDENALESDTRAAERLTFFSDAVIAIAMTLLAIELPIPEGGTVSADRPDGGGVRRLGTRLFVPPRTVQTHVSRILPKTGLRSRVEIARAAGTAAAVT